MRACPVPSGKIYGAYQARRKSVVSAPEVNLTAAEMLDLGQSPCEIGQAQQVVFLEQAVLRLESAKAEDEPAARRLAWRIRL